ncbi:phasin family protein [Bradyrhizobium sp. NAS96.2]|uniref:phasin family protein n=1 Tax=Bradyrhizobium sp. NAS96.2 TaxID=1680160 RepID=UPI0009695EBE|nr:phasin family protein [Bradyrhizobium sp. NAS96.2]OKO78120.1 hypothetical protein AC628_13980 [Bradyrhizobium sp. NAS96.2]
MKVTANGTTVFAMPLPGFGNLAEQGLARARTASEQMAEALGEIYSCNARGATDYGLKMFEISQANAASALEFLVHLLGARSATDALALSAEHARKTFQLASDQNRELWVLGERLAADMAAPVRTHVAKVIKQAA